MQVCGRCRVEKDESSDFSPSYRGKPGTWCRACFAEYNRKRQRGERQTDSTPPNVRVACLHCGDSYTPRQMHPRLMFCSRECKDKARSAAQIAELAARKAELSVRCCAWCSGVVSPSMRSDAKFCSARCNSSAHATTRKSAQRAGLKNRSGDLISLAYVAGRDKWRCGICGGRVAKGLRHPDPMAGSIDHIVPISIGGDPADPANLQLAHFRCNWSKQNKPAGEQLRLLG